mmetsp:Transcript_29468/g.70841  ORF Transcript_29468/g.70841 Transcript_29468/m.70841 type:complete len:261 (-) Transcript_29468:453-1235(-)|eukprot:CAMPEP_0113608680 /NCGR_PEP_ID=MMETSP0017_2-20120614/4063_1 /TAXON_ID=2856 /ORGANISM="Cylindrotheca closterium" /LENGTH=260 /DNA_ID=CAMNT_0000517399 /DNA_START=55 /DNA_END=837 /DNA_ORIENTATION=- /assembly_acc=CAM_ASM_000147
MANKGTETAILLEREMGEQMIEFALQFLTVPDLKKVTLVNRHFSQHVPSRQDVWEPILGWCQRMNPLENLDNPPTCEEIRSARQEPSFWPRMNGLLLPPSFPPPTRIFRLPPITPLDDPRLTPAFSQMSNFEKVMAIQEYANEFQAYAYSRGVPESVWEIVAHGISQVSLRPSAEHIDFISSNGIITSCIIHAVVCKLSKLQLYDFFTRSGMENLMEFMEFSHPQVKLRLFCPAYFYDEHTELVEIVERVAERGHCLLKY